MIRDDERPPRLARRAPQPRPNPLPPDDAQDAGDVDAEHAARKRLNITLVAVAFVAVLALLGAAGIVAVMTIKRADRPQPNPPAHVTPRTQTEPTEKVPAAPAVPTRGRANETVGIDGVFVTPGASVMKEEGDKLLLMLRVETSEDCPPTFYTGWRRALGRLAPIITLPDGTRRYPASNAAFDAAADQMALHGEMFGPGLIGGGRGRVETIMFAPIPSDVGEFDLDLPGRPAGGRKTFLLKVKVDRK